MKKINLLMVLLGLSTSLAHAGGIDNNNSATDDSVALSVGAELLYAQPADNDFVFGTTNRTDAKGVEKRTVSVQPDYQLGYHLDLGYVIPEHGAKLVLGSTYIDARDSKTKGGKDFTPAFDKASDSNKSHAKSENKYRDVDLLIGKEFALQDRYHFHPFAGARYAHIQADNTLNSYDTAEKKKLLRSDKFTNNFTGMGPRIGLDAAVELNNGFSLTARAAGSMLLADNKAKQKTLSYNDKSEVASSVQTKNDGSNITVPGVDYRLGVNYSYEFAPETTVTTELGYTAVHYFDALDKTAANSKTDVAYQGPYLRVQVSLA